MMYVLQIRTGEEEAVLEQLRRQGIAGLLPQELRLTRRRGCWTEEKHKLLPGYLFVDVQYTDSLYYAIVALPAVLRVLKADGRPAPLPEPEEQYIRFLGEKLLSPSVVRQHQNAASILQDPGRTGGLIRPRRETRRTSCFLHSGKLVGAGEPYAPLIAL